MPTLIELPDVESCAQFCKELGLQFLELNMNLPQYQVSALDTALLQQTAQRYGIYYTIHLDENLDPCNFNPHIAEAWTKTTIDTIKFAQKLKIPVLNLHLNEGVYFTLPSEKVYLYQQEKPRYLSALKAFRDIVTAAVQNSDIRVCVENTNGYDRPFLLDGLDLLLESPVFGLTFDTGHDGAIGEKDLSYIFQRKSQLIHMHLHDYSGKKAHLPLGEGELDVFARLDLAKERNCRVVLETKTVAGLKQSVHFLRTAL